MEKKFGSPRVIQLAEKLAHPKNEYCRSRFMEWLKESEVYADKMIDKYGFNKVQNTRESYQLLYILNHYCPSLVHLKKRPLMPCMSIHCSHEERAAAIEEYNCMMAEYNFENTQAGLVDADGTHHPGVAYTKEEFEAFVEEAKKYLKNQEE